jgi:Cu+-exporting ATPase
VEIDNVLADVFPGEKAAEQMKLQEAGNCVAMINAGIDDTPAQSRADVDTTVGIGTYVTVAALPITLNKVDLQGVL